MEKNVIIRKIVISAFALVIGVVASISFYQHRHFEEAVVINEDVQVKKLGEYFEGISGSINDCNVYIIEGDEPGGTMLILGGSHAEEPAGRLANWIMVENAKIIKGKIILVLSANRSGTTVTRPSGAYPSLYSISTQWGEQTFRMGDRWTNPLDQWPDPEVYIHYPSGQNLAYVDIRNLNRTWPGRPNGTLTERTCHAFMQLIDKEEVDLVIDLHEAELQYPVINTIVAHEKGLDVATMVSMILTDFEGFNIGTEFSPKSLHGLSHREIGDFSDAVSLLFEAPQPFLDATRGITGVDLLLEGKDEFVVKAGEHGLLFAKIDENGWHIDTRVGRHISTILQTFESWNEFFPDKEVICEDVPRYAEIVENGVGHYLKNPKEAKEDNIAYE